MLEYCRGLKFKETPDYKYLYTLINTIFAKEEWDWDYRYDWIVSQVGTTEMLITDISKVPAHPNANKKDEREDRIEEKGLKMKQIQMQERPEIIMEE